MRTDEKWILSREPWSTLVYIACRILVKMCTNPSYSFKLWPSSSCIILLHLDISALSQIMSDDRFNIFDLLTSMFNNWEMSVRKQLSLATRLKCNNSECIMVPYRAHRTCMCVIISWLEILSFLKVLDCGRNRSRPRTSFSVRLSRIIVLYVCQGPLTS